MHPLFIAHLIGDYLVQPTWLVQWKKKAVGGVIVHSLLHGAAVFLLATPRTILGALALLIIPLTHGLIDYGKVCYEKKHGSANWSFLLDQLMHLAIITPLAATVNLGPHLGRAESGILILSLLAFFSFGTAIIHMPNKKKLLIASFILFLVPALLLGSFA